MHDRTFVVTGGFGALGTAVAAAALEAGARVVLIDRAARPPESGILKDAAERLLCVPGADLSTVEGAERALNAAHRRFGGFNVLANVAGGFRWQTVLAGDPAVWSELYSMNVLTALHASRASLPYLARQNDARIVNVGAGAALRAQAGMGAYAAAKSAVHRLTESLAEELKESGITVNAVLPTILDTPANRAEMPDADFAKWVSLRDLAAVILFLASPAARAVTGALVPVNGRL